MSEELARLRTLLDAGTVRLGVHIRQMNSSGSPVYRAQENLWAPGLTLVGSLLATRFVHFYLGALVLAAGCAWWLLRVQPRIKDAVFQRTSALVLHDPAQFDFWWSRGVLSLFATLPDGEARAATRKHDWRAWVRALPGEAP